MKSLTRVSEGKTLFQIKMAEKAAAEKQKELEAAALTEANQNKPITQTKCKFRILFYFQLTI